MVRPAEQRAEPILFTRFTWCLKNLMRRLSGLRLLSGVNFSHENYSSTSFKKMSHSAKSSLHHSKQLEGIPSCNNQSQLMREDPLTHVSWHWSAINGNFSSNCN